MVIHELMYHNTEETRSDTEDLVKYETRYSYPYYFVYSRNHEESQILPRLGNVLNVKDYGNSKISFYSVKVTS